MTKKLLLADDSITIQKVIGIIFATEDYQLLVCDDGNEAFDKALEEVPDLVIADVSMPGKDGFELCQAIKSESRLLNTSVLLLPGTFDHFDERRAQDVGADGWLTKPFESQALLDKVAHLLEAEPIRLAAQDESPVAESFVPVTDDLGEERVAEQAAMVDENALGLVDVEEFSAEPAEEESPDDIWDAVSFEEEDLQPQSEELPSVTEEVAGLDEQSMVTPVDRLSAAPEESGSSDPGNKPVEPEGAAAEESGFVFETEEEFLDLSPEDIDEEPLEPASSEYQEKTTAEERPELDGEDELPLELVEDAIVMDEPVADAVAAPVAADLSPVDGRAAAEAIIEESPFSAEAEKVGEFDTEEELPAGPDEDLPIIEPLTDGMLGEDEEILDLADDDILEEYPTAVQSVTDELALEENELLGVETVSDPAKEAFVAEPSFPETEIQTEQMGEEPFAVETGQAAGEEELEEPFVLEDEQGAGEEELEEYVFEVEQDSSADELEASFITAETLTEEAFIEPYAETAQDFAVAPDAAEDEELIAEAFEPEAESFVAPAAVAAAAATGVAAAAAVGAGSSVEQAEDQLRQLSDDELREVVAKVAGPTIEKLANEMLEQVVWEVVPDLAESMIREEIRKIRQGAE